MSDKYKEAKIYIDYLEKELARRDEIIARLKEDGERLARNCTTNNGGYMACIHCLTGTGMHTDTCPITLHRALIAELEKETEK